MEIIIRPVSVADSKAIHALRHMPGVFENILALPSERLEFCEKFVENTDPNKHQFVAITIDANGQEILVGTASLCVESHPRLKHSGSIGIMVHKDYQGQGVGSKLMEAVCDLADNWLMLVRLELTVFVENTKAVHLYEKMGFVMEGTRRMVAVRHGVYADEFMMARIRA